MDLFFSFEKLEGDSKGGTGLETCSLIGFCSCDWILGVIFKSCK